MRALVLSGGGSRGAYQVGALRYMLGTLKLDYDIVVGTSVGAINAAEVAMWSRGQEAQAAASLEQLWSGLTTADVVDYRFMQPVSLLWNPSLTTFGPLRRLLEERLDMERMRGSGRLYRAAAVDITTGEFLLYSEGCTKEEMVQGILASSATPILHEPTVTEHRFLYDGGIRDVSPIGHAIELGANEIDLVLVESKKIPAWTPGANRVWDTAPRVFQVMFRELVEGDICRTLDKNALVEAHHPRGAGKRHVELRIVRPDEPLPGDAATFDPENAVALMALGEADARRIDFLSDKR